MIDYTSWQPPQYTSETEPTVLSVSQRKVFWMVVRGYTLVQIAELLGCSVRTVQSHNVAIHEKIPGLLNFAAYGALAAEIISESRQPGIRESLEPSQLDPVPKLRDRRTLAATEPGSAIDR